MGHFAVATEADQWKLAQDILDKLEFFKIRPKHVGTSRDTIEIKAALRLLANPQFHALQHSREIRGGTLCIASAKQNCAVFGERLGCCKRLSIDIDVKDITNDVIIFVAIDERKADEHLPGRAMQIPGLQFADVGNESIEGRPPIDLQNDIAYGFRDWRAGPIAEQPWVMPIVAGTSGVNKTPESPPSSTVFAICHGFCLAEEAAPTR